MVYLRDVALLIALVAVELAAVIIGARLLYRLADMVVRLVTAMGVTGAPNSPARRTVRNAFLVTSLLLAIGVLIYNGVLAWRGENVLAHTRSVLGSISPAAWLALGMAFAKVIAAAVGFFILTRLVRRMLAALERAINRWDRLKSNDESLDHLFAGLGRGSTIAAWLLLVAFAGWLFSAPEGVLQILLVVFRIYLVVIIGMRSEERRVGIDR